MKYDYDVLVIGLGPAGMAVAAMSAEMGLRVCAVEKNAIGGECMNVGCIPSKALLRMAKNRHSVTKFAKYALSEMEQPSPEKTFATIDEHLKYISEKKTIGMFSKVELIYRQGAATFAGTHRVRICPDAGDNYGQENVSITPVDDENTQVTKTEEGFREITAKKIFICTGTHPAVPKIEGITTIDYLTNENMFSLDKVPKSLIVMGGGAIACEMAQAFSRLGSDVTMIIRGPRLIWREDEEVSLMLEDTLQKEGITILREQNPIKFENTGGGDVRMHTDANEEVVAEKLLVATGRNIKTDHLNLAAANVLADENGIRVDKLLRTSQKHILACGDCNGHHLFSHAAMHQGMIALMNCMFPPGMKKDFKKYVVPWTIFTEQQISRVGMSPRELDEKGIKYDTVQVRYEDYGAAIAECVVPGFIKAYVSPLGKIHGVYIVGEGSGEMINEWALAIQHKITLRHILFQQHSFPTMGFLTKRVAETWVMKKMKSSFLRRMCRLFFR